ncbi:hypothetical protein SSPO_079050 [Streptomyces antimycoticus]|uniref:Uncharacterized protein n=1 Tax=Streptomyces antimycoticus TaxID=68175 RepID=A0A499VG98_9ACTN|nr:hypothetical protein SSPO_079050 [Streptomyces antimycoticus]
MAHAASRGQTVRAPEWFRLRSRVCRVHGYPGQATTAAAVRPDTSGGSQPTAKAHNGFPISRRRRSRRPLDVRLLDARAGRDDGRTPARADTVADRLPKA